MFSADLVTFTEEMLHGNVFCTVQVHEKILAVLSVKISEERISVKNLQIRQKILRNQRFIVKVFLIRYIKLLSSDEKCLGYLLYHHYHVTDVSLIDNCRSLIRTWDQNYAGGLVFFVCNLSSGKDNKSQIQYPCHKSIIDVDTTS